VNRWVSLVIVVGILLRVGVFLVTPPSNSYDDHLEAVSKTIDALEMNHRVAPWECWECYQPPLYYWVGSFVAGVSSLFLEDFFVWKFVQSLSLMASIIALFLTAIAIRIAIPRAESLPAVYFCVAVISVLPRSIYSSAMATNDAFLEASVATAIVGYLIIARGTEHTPLGIILISIGTVASCWIKQSGLVLLVPLVGMSFATLLGLWTPPRGLTKNTILLVTIATFLISGLDEFWRFNKSGMFLVSNQQYYSYAVGQLPGSIASVSFFDFRFHEIYESVFMTPASLDSFWTEVFSRFWFDYERRFFPINEHSVWTGRIAYIFGAVMTPYILYFMLVGLVRRPHDLTRLILVCFVSAFVTVPILQTIRYPYFSSMKSVFILPGISAILCLTAIGLAGGMTVRLSRTVVWSGTILLLIFGVFHTSSLALLSSEAWNHGVSGPLWPLPKLR
jgi:hypothetical protein